VAIARTEVLEESIRPTMRLKRIIFTHIVEAIHSSETSVITRVTSQKTAFFIATAVKTSNLT
jgi:hypothetical protein